MYIFDSYIKLLLETESKLNRNRTEPKFISTYKNDLSDMLEIEWSVSGTEPNTRMLNLIPLSKAQNQGLLISVGNPLPDVEAYKL